LAPLVKVTDAGRVIVKDAPERPVTVKPAAVIPVDGPVSVPDKDLTPAFETVAFPPDAPGAIFPKLKSAVFEIAIGEIMVAEAVAVACANVAALKANPTIAKARNFVKFFILKGLN
jgi:hypothetical protein